MKLIEALANTIVKPPPLSHAERIASVYHIKINSLQGQPIDLSDFKGKKILIVNVASKCGFTSQYKDLQKLHEAYSDRLQIIGVPCNQFGKQEPGTKEEIQDFCELNYGVTFLMTEKMNVRGANKHPLYKWLTRKSENNKKSSSVKWNFQKYLLNENGQLIDYYFPLTGPYSGKIIKHLN
ncbi:MAG: glutathione peroxidase [Bacteroidia bacterium]|nr:glutathione peroxidase [Bacteroidia bacterium]NND52283.1 glutathione peroxidase [Flavobacteriaceae bacterium]